MDLFDVAKAVFRRWYVVVPLILVAAWYSNDMYHSVKPVYYSNAVLSIAPPSFRVDQNLDGTPVPRNGLIDIGGATLITNLTALGLKDPVVVGKVLQGGGQPDYGARVFPVPPNSPELPLVMIEATESTPDSAAKTVQLVVAEANSTIYNLQQQAAVPEDQMVKVFVASPPSAPIAGIPSRTRATLAVLAGGIGLALLIGVLADIFINRLKRRWQKRPKQPAEPVRERRSQVQYELSPDALTDTSQLRASSRFRAPDDVPMGR